jgi:hypothetical protein
MNSYNDFFEEDEDPTAIQRAFDQGEKGVTAPPSPLKVIERPQSWGFVMTDSENVISGAETGSPGFVVPSSNVKAEVS